jgi:hypothetical protein
MIINTLWDTGTHQGIRMNPRVSPGSLSIRKDVLCVANCGRTVKADEARAIEVAFLAAYRWQYIHSGARHPYFGKVLNGLITETQRQRIQAALATLH